ncbi:hypothetical protein NPIL_433301 [Nephila pilipes]|uniref:Uncharacterized protein n=1 Tax=Nephila pilipes TaxID=299642 RepID=A0A8X6PHA5_NEPPI|nr:hypothetical protein NPIL_433301 [Nephila pilipes]
MCWTVSIIGFRLTFNSYHPALLALVGMNDVLYFRIVDIAQSLEIKNGYCFTKHFASDIVQEKDVLPPLRRYPHHTMHARLVTTLVVFCIISAEYVALADKFFRALDFGFTDVVGR